MSSLLYFEKRKKKEKKEKKGKTPHGRYTSRVYELVIFTHNNRRWAYFSDIIMMTRGRVLQRNSNPLFYASVSRISFRFFLFSHLAFVLLC